MEDGANGPLGALGDGAADLGAMLPAVVEDEPYFEEGEGGEGGSGSRKRQRTVSRAPRQCGGQASGAW
jgi:hypothetical protein